MIKKVDNDCSSKNNFSFIKTHGLNLGKNNGPYNWPYAACSGKINDKGLFLPLKINESYNICMDFCNKSNKITGKNKVSKSFNKLSGTDYITCKLQCDAILNTLDPKNNVKEYFKEDYKESKSSCICWIVISLSFITLLIFLFISLKFK